MKKLLEVRKAIKRRKPNFVAQGAGRLKEVKPRWRRPKGMHSKQRLRKKGHLAHVETGYRSPREVRGTTPSGLFPIVVNNVQELARITHGQGIVINSAVGMRKRAAIIAEALTKKLHILNIRKPESYAGKVQETLAGRKKKKVELEKKQKETEKKKMPAKKTEEKKEHQPELTEDEKKKEEKQEKDKILTKKE